MNPNISERVCGTCRRSWPQEKESKAQYVKGMFSDYHQGPVFYFLLFDYFILLYLRAKTGLGTYTLIHPLIHPPNA